MILHGLCAPTKCAKNKSKNVWKFSITDSQETFLSYYETEDARDEGVHQMNKKNKEYNISTNLFITAVGPSLNEAKFQVTYDQIIYIFTDILQALECGFKIIMVFNLSYQIQCSSFWQLLQGCLSDIDITDHCSPAMRTHIENIREGLSDLNSIKNNVEIN